MLVITWWDVKLIFLAFSPLGSSQNYISIIKTVTPWPPLHSLASAHGLIEHYGVNHYLDNGHDQRMWRNGFDSVLIRSWWCTLGQGHFKGAVWFPIGSRFSSCQLRHTPPRTVPRWVSAGNFHCLTKWFIFLEYHNSWRVRFSIQFRDGSLNESGKITYFGPFWYRRFLVKFLDIYSARQCKGKPLAWHRIYTDHQPNQMSKTLPSNGMFGEFSSQSVIAFVRMQCLWQNQTTNIYFCANLKMYMTSARGAIVWISGISTASGNQCDVR